MELGRELATEGIRVNAVSPGSIEFPSGGWDSLRGRDPERVEQFIERDFPFGRLGTPEEWTARRAALPILSGRTLTE